ncbi:MAG TPA: type II toxin-antitoxin system ParD family antitoxin [Stellaceae bacterium]|nr:type II toxin-antitoxin system ParD family antitoxin [Stellaceae bacterium]
MPTRNVVVTDHQAAMIEELVKSGRYQNASEVLREGLRLLEQRDANFQTRLIALREAAKTGWDDIEAGRARRFKTGGELQDYLDSLIEEEIDDQSS